MADHQRIHPVDVEAPAPPPSAPLVSRESTKSENRDPTEQQHHHQQRQSQYPPFRRTLPVQYSRPPKKRRSCCCKCFCWTVLTLVLLVIAMAATLGILYLIFDPKIPEYSVDRLRIADFTVDTNFTVHASFDFTVTTHNPNKKIGIYYKNGSHLNVLYSATTLCSGSFPEFYQGHQNTTVLTVVLTGEAQMGSTVMNALQQQQQTGMVPLDFKGDVPVKVKLGALKLWTVTLRVECDLVVNSLTTNNPISIKSSSCKFRLKKLFS